MRRLMKAATVVVLVFSVLFADSTMAFAFTKAAASNMDEVVDIVSEAGVKREDRIMIDYTGDTSEIDKIEINPDNFNYNFLYGKLLMRDDPNTSDDADYLVGNICVSNDFFDIYYYKTKPQLIFNMDYFETAEQTKYVNDHVGEILKSIGVQGKSNYEKVKAIHDYLCELITYDSLRTDSNAMYGAITNRRAICNAYSLCMYKLCVEAGIPCKYIGGYAGKARNAGGHAWNIVALGDKWYYVDVTWDDTENGIVYDYFLKGTEDFDEVDPEYGHFKDEQYYWDAFTNTFPIARTAFVEGSPDENKLIRIAGTNPGNADPEVTYKKSEIIKKTIPSNKQIKAKKKKITDLVILLKDKRAAALVSTVWYDIKKGKKIIKDPEGLNVGIGVEKGQYYVYLEFKGMKKGKVSITVHMLLANGQQMEVTFSGKIK